MKTFWFKDTDSEQDKEERRAQFVAADPILSRLREHLKDRIRSIDDNRDSESYSSQWQFSEHQAKAAGERKAYKHLLDLIG